MNDVIKVQGFSNIDLKDEFFDSLKDDYPGFENWFEKKQTRGAEAFVIYYEKKISGFLYLKEENEEDNSISPVFSKMKRLKIGTFKIDAHGTVLGQRFLRIILTKFVEGNFSEVYVTLFPKQEGLIMLFETFGFKLWGEKDNGELVYYKDIETTENIYLDYPRINMKSNKYLLSIYPKFHTDLFPDSKLQIEKHHMIEDKPHTNTAEKIYIAGMKGIQDVSANDIVVIYRTASGGSAEYTSVVTTLCTVVEIRHMKDFSDMTDFINYCGKGSIFSERELETHYKTRKYPFVIKMLYNVSLSKRPNRKALIEQAGISRSAYPGIMKLTDDQFEKILELGEVDPNYFIN